MSDHRHGRWVSIATYAGTILLLVTGLMVMLPLGSTITPAPHTPGVGDVSGGAERCLGERVAFVQSGVFLDVHVPGTHGMGDRDIGAKLVGGRIDRSSGQVELTGTCAARSELGAVPVTLAADVLDGEGLRGEAQVGGRILPVVVVEATTTVGAGAEQPQLTGGALLSRILLGVAIVIVVARALGTVFRRIGQPRVIGEITAGILLGPSLLGLVFPEVTAFLFPAAVTDVLRILAQFGLIFFMFLIGLELDHKMIRGSGNTAVLVSHCSIVLPLVLGVGAAVIVYPVVGSGNFTGFALFMGAAMAITAFPVLARILTDTGLYKTRLGALSITCAAVDDVTAWCILAIVVAIVRATGTADAVITIAFSLAFILAMLFLVRPVLDRLLSFRGRNGRVTATVMSLLIAGLFLSAWVTELIGIHAIFGAFMFGAIMPRQRGMATRIIERLEDITVLFLLPVFFAVVGLSTRIGLVTGAQLWLLTALIIAIAIIGKIGGSVIAGLAANETLRSSTVIGVLMNARGITEIVILTIGRELGVISPALFTIMVIMALVTTVMTTPLLARIYPRRMVERDIRATRHREAAQRDYGSRRVMVGVTDPEAAKPLVRLAGWLRGADQRPPTVVLASVIAPAGLEQVRANLKAHAETSAAAAANLSTVADGLDREGVSSEVITRIGTDRGEELRLLSEQHAIDLILIGSHESFLRNRPLGGLVGELLRTAPSDVVALLNADELETLGEGPVGVWLPGEPSDIAAYELAASVARGIDRPIRVVATPAGLPPSAGEDTVDIGEDGTVERVMTELAGSALLVVAAPTLEQGLDVDVVEALTTRGTAPTLVLRPTSGDGPAHDGLGQATPADAATPAP